MQCGAAVDGHQLQGKLYCVSIQQLLGDDGQLKESYALDGVHACPAASITIEHAMSQLQ